MKTTHAAAIAVAMLAMSTPSHADVIVKDGRPADVPYREVRFADLNLDSQQGLDSLNTRILSAVRSVCGQADLRQLIETLAVRNCRDTSTHRAFAARDAMLAARLAARDDPAKLAALTGSITFIPPKAR